jgi:hypothetical protein
VSGLDLRVNRAMVDAVAKGEAIDISKCRRTITGAYILAQFIDDKDYCDARLGLWVWSIGRLNAPLPSVMADNSREVLPIGTCLAALDSRFYTAGTSGTVECVWLR